MRFKMIPKLYEGETVLILGGGPSLPDLFIRKVLSAYHVIGVNDAGLFAFADVLFFGDARWWYFNQHHPIDPMEKGVFTYNRHPEALLEPYPKFVQCVDGKSGFGICPDNPKIKFNRSSGAAAINLAYHFGAKQIILLGFDMRQIDGKKNWHMPRFWETDNTRNMTYEKFLAPFDAIKRDADKFGIQIFNTTPGSALTQFPYLSIKDL